MLWRRWSPVAVALPTHMHTCTRRRIHTRTRQRIPKSLHDNRACGIHNGLTLLKYIWNLRAYKNRLKSTSSPPPPCAHIYLRRVNTSRMMASLCGDDEDGDGDVGEDDEAAGRTAVVNRKGDGRSPDSVMVQRRVRHVHGTWHAHGNGIVASVRRRRRHTSTYIIPSVRCEDKWKIYYTICCVRFIVYARVHNLMLIARVRAIFQSVGRTNGRTDGRTERGSGWGESVPLQRW